MPSNFTLSNTVHVSIASSVFTESKQILLDVSAEFPSTFFDSTKVFSIKSFRIMAFITDAPHAKPVIRLRLENESSPKK